jgi:transcription initiation factor IIE alpha subunit
VTNERTSPTDDRVTDDTDPSATDVFDEMEPFEPYTTGELASVLDIPKRLAGKLLTMLTADGQIRRKELEPDQAIWIREPPKHACPECNREFEIKYFHPVFQAVQFCPRCGTQLE